MPPDLMARLGLAAAPAPSRYDGIGLWGGDPVGPSEDLDRVLALPSRPRPSDLEQHRMAAQLTAELEQHPDTDPTGAPCGCPIHHLLPVQGWYLHEARRGGALGLLAVGAGKTGIGLLLPMLMPKVRTAVLLVPPALRTQLRHDYEVWSRHFRVPNLGGGSVFVAGRPVLHILAYSELSHERCATWLTSIDPDLIIADEVQCIAARSSVRTSRFLRYFDRREKTARVLRFAAHSGTLTTRSIEQYAHLAAVALREGSPLPLAPATVSAWSGAIDPVTNGAPTPPGQLLQLATSGETVREGFRRRLVTTPGVISTVDVTLPVRLLLGVRAPPATPPSVAAALAETRSTATRPDGEQFEEATETIACLRQLACGFFYRWIYPRGESVDLIDRWFTARKAWFGELRERLEGEREDLLDSPGLLRLAAERSHAGYQGEAPTWRSRAWAPWEAVRDLVKPAVATTWISDWLVRDAVVWGRDAPGLVWYQHRAFGEAVAALGGWRRYGAGEESARALLTDTGAETVVVSIEAHHKGKNMQAWHRNLVTSAPSDAGRWEQLLGRTHRTNQRRDVTCLRYRHTPETSKAFNDAIERAEYVQTTTGNAQKLLYAESLDAVGGQA